MKNFASFIKVLLPPAIDLVRALFVKHKGDAEAAKRDIESRVEEMRSVFDAAETALAEKYASEDEEETQ